MDGLKKVEVVGVFARVEEVCREYGRLTEQKHIAYATHFAYTDRGIEVVYEDKTYDEYEHGRVPLAAFADMEAAVAAYAAEKEKKRRAKAEQEAQWEYGQYLRLKAKYEAK